MKKDTRLTMSVRAEMGQRNYRRALIRSLLDEREKIIQHDYPIWKEPERPPCGGSSNYSEEIRQLRDCLLESRRETGEGKYRELAWKVTTSEDAVLKGRTFGVIPTAECYRDEGTDQQLQEKEVQQAAVKPEKTRTDSGSVINNASPMNSRNAKGSGSKGSTPSPLKKEIRIKRPWQKPGQRVIYDGQSPALDKLTEQARWAFQQFKSMEFTEEEVHAVSTVAGFYAYAAVEGLTPEDYVQTLPTRVQEDYRQMIIVLARAYQCLHCTRCLETMKKL